MPAYRVTTKNRKGEEISTRYVKASSDEKAKANAIRVENEVFGGKATSASIAARICRRNPELCFGIY